MGGAGDSFTVVLPAALPVETTQPMIAEPVAEEKAEAIVDLNATASAPSCNSVCQSSGGAFGQIIGTAPFCDASCDGDCPSPRKFCFTSSKDAGLVDYGAGCATGDKVCCCMGGAGDSFSVVLPAALPVETTQPMIAEPVAEEKAEAIVELNATASAPSCNSVCQSS